MLIFCPAGLVLSFYKIVTYVSYLFLVMIAFCSFKWGWFSVYNKKQYEPLANIIPVEYYSIRTSKQLMESTIMTTNIILEKARMRDASRKLIGECYNELSRLSLKLLVKECGGQSNAAEIIACLYASKKSQGTLCKALKSGGDQTRNELRIAMDLLSQKEYTTEIMSQLVAHLGSLPIYHDILSYQDRYVLYVDSIMISTACYVVVINQDGNAETIRLTDVGAI